MAIVAGICIGLAFAVGVSCSREPRLGTATEFTVNLTVQPDQRPRTLAQAADLLLAAMPPESKARFAATERRDLIVYHHGLGKLIRNEFGLWKDNPELLTNCHAIHPDDASMVIITAAWQKVQTQK